MGVSRLSGPIRSFDPFSVPLTTALKFNCLSSNDNFIDRLLEYWKSSSGPRDFSRTSVDRPDYAGGTASGSSRGTSYPESRFSRRFSSSYSEHDLEQRLRGPNHNRVPGFVKPSLKKGMRIKCTVDPEPRGNLWKRKGRRPR